MSCEREGSSSQAAGLLACMLVAHGDIRYLPNICEGTVEASLRFLIPRSNPRVSLPLSIFPQHPSRVLFSRWSQISVLMPRILTYSTLHVLHVAAPPTSIMI